MIDINSIFSDLLSGIEWGVVITLIAGAVSWGFWAVVGFFKSASRA